MSPNRWLDPRSTRPSSRTLLDVVRSIDQLIAAERKTIIDAEIAQSRFDRRWGALCDVGRGLHRFFIQALLAIVPIIFGTSATAAPVKQRLTASVCALNAATTACARLHLLDDRATQAPYTRHVQAREDRAHSP